MVNPNGIKTLLANFHIKRNPVFSNGPKSLPKTPSDCLKCYIESFYIDIILKQNKIITF